MQQQKGTAVDFTLPSHLAKTPLTALKYSTGWGSKHTDALCLSRYDSPSSGSAGHPLQGWGWGWLGSSAPLPLSTPLTSTPGQQHRAGAKGATLELFVGPLKRNWMKLCGKGRRTEHQLSKMPHLIPSRRMMRGKQGYQIKFLKRLFRISLIPQFFLDSEGFIFQ